MSTKKPNPFIVIEALDAGGSQTQTNLLAERLKADKYDILQLHFPQEDRATGRLIYDKFLLSKNKGKFSRREQALIYLQDFYARYEDIVRARAVSNKRSIVLSDRFCTSTFAYQTIGLTGKKRQAMLNWLLWLAWENTPALPKPDAVIFLDTPVAVSLQRLKDKPKDYFETKTKLTAIRNSYLKISHEQKWHVINSVDEAGIERSRQDLHEAVWQVVTPLTQS